MGNQLDSDLPEEVVQLKKSKGKQFLTDHCLKILPEKWKQPPGKLMSFYHSLPPGEINAVSQRYVNISLFNFIYLPAEVSDMYI